MMIISGPLTLGSTCQMYTTTRGLPQLLLEAFEAGIGANGVAYKLVWTGQFAQRFFDANEHLLKIGAQLNVIAINPRPLSQGGDLYVLASVSDIQVIPRATPTPQTKWVTRHEAAEV